VGDSALQHRPAVARDTARDAESRLRTADRVPALRDPAHCRSAPLLHDRSHSGRAGDDGARVQVADREAAAAGRPRRQALILSTRGPGRPPRDESLVTARVAVLRELEPGASVRSLARCVRVRREAIRAALQRLEAARGWAQNPTTGFLTTQRPHLSAPRRPIE